MRHPARLSHRLALASAACGLLLAGCASVAPPPQLPPFTPTARPAPAPVEHAQHGEVLARNERFVVYVPAPGDSLRSIAARFLGDEGRDWLLAEFNRIVQAEAGRALVVPLQPPNPIGVRAAQAQRVPILCYHRFGPGGGRMQVTPERFAQQLDWLAANGWRVVRLADLQRFMAGQQALPRRAVVITIDDGYASTLRHALPALRKHGFAATLFVYTDFIGSSAGLTLPQLQELAASGLIDVQSHSKTHRNLALRLPGETDERYRQMLDQEARAPRELLERWLGTPVQHFAYPFGDTNATVVEALARADYQLGLSVTPGANPFYAAPWVLRRTMVYGDHDLEAFKARLELGRGPEPP